MRLNLNFRDAIITKLSASKYKITFDLSKFNRHRLSEHSRMFIENLNLCEWVDDAYGGVNGKINGYLEIRCLNISENDFNSDYSPEGSIIYTSPLINFNTFHNTNPLHIANFKISQDFLQNNFTLYINIFDQYGNDYTTVKNVASVLPTTGIPYTDYITAVNELDVLTKKKIIIDKIYEDNDVIYNTALSYLKSAEIDLNNAKSILIKNIDVFTADLKVSMRNRIKLDVLKSLINLNNTNEIMFLFENVLPAYMGVLPYLRFASELEEYYRTFLNKIKSSFDVLKAKTDLDNITSSKEVRINTFASFTSLTTNLLPGNRTVDYTVIVPSSFPKTGSLKINYFLSTDSRFAFNYIVVDDIVPDIGVQNELLNNDILTINSSHLEALVPDDYQYFFAKTDDKNILGVLTTGLVADTRFGFDIARNGLTYSFNLNPKITSKGFKVGNVITVDGSFLGGNTPANDLRITVDSLFVPPASETYTFTNYTPPEYPTNGTMDLVITRNNTAIPTYTLDSEDYTNTINYSKNNKFSIKGLSLGGGLDNGLKFTVREVIEAFYSHNIDETNSEHSIPKTIIKETNSTVYDSTNTEKPQAIGYKIYVESINGEYTVSVNPLVDNSVNFDVGDYILVKGSVLTGEDTVNDLRIDITSVDVANKIDDVEVDTTGTYIARVPVNGYSFLVKININSDEYELSDLIGNEFAKGDMISVDASVVKGDAIVNDLVVNIKDIVSSNPGDPSVIIGQATAYGSSSLAKEYNGVAGQIVKTNRKGTPLLLKEEGSIATFTVDPTSVAFDIGTIPIPNITVDLNGEDPIEGVSIVDADITAKNAEVVVKKTALINSNPTYITSFGANQDMKLKTINMKMVLYDEVPEFSSTDKDVITGNTYSRLNNPQFKRL